MHQIEKPSYDHNMSPIEEIFSRAAKSADLALKSEWQIGRYRVDFLHENTQTIIELDGHETHSSPEDIEKDCIRSRYLQREGYRVVRFTGREIKRDATRCVNEFKQFIFMASYKHSDQAVFVDWPFLDRQANKYLLWRQNHLENEPKRTLSLSKILDCLCKKISSPTDSSVPLINKSTCDVFLYGRPSAFSTSLLKIDTFKFYVSNKCIFRVTEIQPDFTAVTMIDDIESTADLFKELVLIDDDMAYCLLRDNDQISAIVRRDEDTNMADFKKARYLKMEPFLGWALGLQPHEM